MSLTTIFLNANESTGDLFQKLLILSIYLVVFLYLAVNRRELLNSAIAAGFITSMSTALLFYANIVTLEYIIGLSIASLFIPIAISYIFQD